MADEQERPAEDGAGDAGDAGEQESGQQEGGEEDGPREDAGKHPGNAERSTYVYQNFQGDVFADQGTFGNNGSGVADEGGRRGGGRKEGRLEDSVIAGIVRTYARPECYDDAARALTADRVVILTGEKGTGRRAGAIAMLAGIRLADKSLVRINPSTTVEALASAPREFSEGTAYLIIDKFPEHIAPELAEYHWEEVCRKIRKAKAHLVVTAAPGSIGAMPDVSQVAWHRPGAADALRAHLGAARVPGDVVGQVAGALGTGYPVSRIGSIARRILAGDDLGELLDELQSSDRRAVAGWLNEVDAEIPAVLEVAVLAFVLGVPESVFEDEVAALKPRLAQFAPDLDIGSTEVKAEIDLRFRQLRKERAEHKLITVRQLPVVRISGAIPVRHVDFRVPASRQHVVAELSDRLGREFWRGVRQWLHAIAKGDGYEPGRHSDLMNSVAIGLSLLALADPGEVIDSYLTPWTAEDATLSEQTMAVYVVWRMSMLDQLSAHALRIAILWAGQGSKTQRMLAAYAFSGELGARYPVEATKRLGQLADQGEPMVTLAFAHLFATLATQKSDATVVIRELRRRLADKKGDRPATTLVLSTVAELLSVRDYHAGRPAVAVFLIANPERAADIGPLWAEVLRMRPWRDRSITALRATVGAIAHRTFGSNARRLPESDAERLVRSLGSATGKALPEPERENLRSEITRRAEDGRRRERRGRKSADNTAEHPSSADADWLLEVFLNAIVNPFPRELGE